MSGCEEKCWTPVLCPEHGNHLTPFGRSAPFERTVVGCDCYSNPAINPRHLWDEHDSTRWYTDPDGWTAHEASCKQCAVG